MSPKLGLGLLLCIESISDGKNVHFSTLSSFLPYCSTWPYSLQSMERVLKVGITNVLLLRLVSDLREENCYFVIALGSCFM